MMFRCMTVIIFLVLSIIQPAFAKTETIRVCLPTFREELTSLTLLAAQDLKAYERAGLTVEIKLKGPRERSEYSLKNSASPEIVFTDYRVAETVANGGCDIGSSVIDRMIMATPHEIENTEPLMISSYNKDYDTHLVTAKNSKIKTLKDLKGKRVRMGQLPNGMALSGLLQKEGLSLKDIEQVLLVSVVDVPSMLENGKLDAAITYVPTMPYMLASGKVRVLSQNLLGNLTGSPLPHSLILVNKSFRQKNPELMKKFMTALAEAQKHFERNPSQIAVTLSKHAQFLHVGKWQLDPVVTERSGAFIGKINLTDLTTDEASRLRISNDVRAFSKKLESLKYVDRANDLSRWFGVNVQAAL